MKNTDLNWFKLKSYMETEKIVLNTYSERNKGLRALVQSMDWPTLDFQLRELEDLSCQLKEIDRRRHMTFTKIIDSHSEKRDLSFFDLTNGLDSKLKKEIRQLHNHIKILTDKIKIESRVTSVYVEARTKSLKDMLGEIIPETKNVFYNPNGLLVKGSMGTSSLLVDRSL